MKLALFILAALPLHAQFYQNQILVIPNATQTTVGLLGFADLSSPPVVTGWQSAATNTPPGCIWSLPPADGAANSVLTTNGTCATSWQSVGSLSVANGFTVTGESAVSPPTTTMGLTEYYDNTAHQAYLQSYNASNTVAPLNLLASQFVFTGPIETTVDNGFQIGTLTDAFSDVSAWRFDLLVGSATSFSWRPDLTSGYGIWNSVNEEFEHTGVTTNVFCTGSCQPYERDFSGAMLPMQDNVWDLGGSFDVRSTPTTLRWRNLSISSAISLNSGYGTAGQVLTSQGGGPDTWTNVNTVVNGFTVTGESAVSPPTTTVGLTEYYDGTGLQAYIQSYNASNTVAPLNLLASQFVFTGPIETTVDNGFQIGTLTDAFSDVSAWRFDLLVGSATSFSWRPDLTSGYGIWNSVNEEFEHTGVTTNVFCTGSCQPYERDFSGAMLPMQDNVWDLGGSFDVRSTPTTLRWRNLSISSAISLNSGYGTAGQVLTSQGGGPDTWTNVNTVVNGFTVTGESAVSPPTTTMGLTAYYDPSVHQSYIQSYDASNAHAPLNITASNVVFTAALAFSADNTYAIGTLTDAPSNVSAWRYDLLVGSATSFSWRPDLTTGYGMWNSVGAEFEHTGLTTNAFCTGGCQPYERDFSGAMLPMQDNVWDLGGTFNVRSTPTTLRWRNLNISSAIQLSSGYGSSGQVLTSGGGGPDTWSTVNTLVNGFTITGQSAVSPPTTTVGLTEYYDPSGHQAYLQSYNASNTVAPLNLLASQFVFTGPLAFSVDNAFAIGTSANQPSAVFGRAMQSEKYILQDNAGGSLSFNIQAQVGTFQKSIAFNDQLNNPMLEMFREFAGATDNEAMIDATFYPCTGFYPGTGTACESSNQTLGTASRPWYAMYLSGGGGGLLVGGTTTIDSARNGYFGNVNATSANNFTVGSSGNFYNRTVSSSTGISCSGVADGWTAITSDDYVVSCLGGNRFRAPLVSY